MPRYYLRLIVKRYKILLVLMLMVLQGCDLNTRSRWQPVAKDGVLDLRQWDFTNSGLTNLDGEWHFYWNKLLIQSELSANRSTSELFVVPNTWSNESVGYATFSLKVLLGKVDQQLAFKIPHFATAYRMYMNGRLIASAGNVGTTKETSAPKYRPIVVDFLSNKKEIDLIIQIANFHYRKGGVWKSILLGEEEDIRQADSRKLATELLLFGAILIMGIYHVAMFLFRREEKAPLYFGLFCFLISFRILVTDEIYISRVIADFPWFLLVKLEYLTYYLTIPVFTFYMYSLYPKQFLKWTFTGIQVIGFSFSAIVVITPATVFSETVQTYQVFTVCSGFYAVYLLFASLLKKQQGVMIFLIGFVTMLVTVINDILYANNIIQTAFLLQVGFFIFILFQAILLTSRASYSFAKVERLTSELEENNLLLEQRVVERTEELREANRELNSSLKEVKSANFKILSSISYARRIQNSLLPNHDRIKQFIPDNMLIWKPRDIVGGDIFFANRFENGFLVAVMDCTGHGVPGAIMTMLASSSLRRITIDEGCTEPALILRRLNLIIKKSLQQDADFATSDDGLDASICFVDFEKNVLVFSGARQSLIYSNGSAIESIKGDKESIGYKKSNPDFEFKSHSIPLKTTKSFYLYTDGFVDQLGGANRRSFGQRRFRELVQENKNLPFETQKENLNAAFDQYRGINEVQDDITVFAFRVPRLHPDSVNL